jgi:hypothetical protein
MNNCIVCDRDNESISIEHIVPESFGNKKYKMDAGSICDDCNARFSKFEGKALSNSVFVMERARLGVSSKKGKPARGLVGSLQISGDSKFEEQLVNIEGINEENLTDYDAKTGTYQLFVPSFDKSEVATARFLLMLGIESLYKSRKDIFEKYDLSELKDYLTNRSNDDWGLHY